MIHYMYHVLSCVDMIKAKRQQICLEFHYRLILSLFISCSVSVTLAKRKHSWVFSNLHVQNGSSVNSKKRKCFFLWIRCTLIAVKYDAQNYFTARKRSCGKVMLLHPGQTPSRQTPHTPGQTSLPPPETATEAGGKHPTGMHSCCLTDLGQCQFHAVLLKYKILIW